MDRGAVERQIRALLEDGHRSAAVTRAVELHGAEILGWLVGILPCHADAEDVFAEFCADLVRDLPSFRWDASLRTWLYKLAYHGLCRHHRSRRRRRRLLPSCGSEPAVIPRTATAPYLRTEVKDRFVRLRDRLAAADQALLVLRVDRRLAWRDVADVLGMRGGTAAVRKRFERVKRRLRELARAEGLIAG